MQGVLERYSALGTPLRGLIISRTSLNVVRLIGLDSRNVTFTVLSFKLNNQKHHYTGSIEFDYGDKVICVVDADRDYFHEAEIREMGIWLLENFHH